MRGSASAYVADLLLKECSAPMWEMRLCKGTWLEVAVEVALLVDEGQALKDGRAPLPHELLWQQPLAALHQLVQVALLQCQRNFA